MSNDRQPFYLGTAIDGPHFGMEQLFVRSKNLNELIGEFSFTEALFHIIHGDRPTEQQRKLLDIVLVAFHGGFGVMPPTTLLPRFVVGTGGSIPQALAAGYLASGPYHVGAVEQAMRFYHDVLTRFREKIGTDNTAPTAGELEKFAFQCTSEVIDRRETIPGYGHPLLRKDPRPLRIRRAVADLQCENPFLDICDGVARCALERKGIPPNVDGMTGAILLTLNFEPRHGTAFFLLARTAAMIAHALEESTEMPYQTQRRFMFLPIAMPKLFNSDFNKLTRFFNRLRDNKGFKSIQGLFGRKKKHAVAEATRANEEAVAEARTSRASQSIRDEIAASRSELPSEDPFVAASEQANPVSESPTPLDPIEETQLAEELDAATQPELLATAAVCLAAARQQQTQMTAGHDTVTEVETLLQRAMELLQQGEDDG